MIAPDKCAASGTRELWIFDPMMAGPASHNGPWLLQIWRRDESGFGRIYEGAGPAFSLELDAHVVVVDEFKLRIASDPAGHDLLPTAEETAAARIAELEAALRGR